MSKAYEKVMAGSRMPEATWAENETGSRCIDIEVPEPDVVAIRGKTGLSQPAFAKSIGVPLGTLKIWEQGRRRPEGSARVLLALIEKTPVDRSGRTRPLEDRDTGGNYGKTASTRTGESVAPSPVE